MEQTQCIIKKKKYQHLSFNERIKLEVLLGEKKRIKEIAQVTRRHRSTIYRELERGSIKRLQYDLREKKTYRANVGQEEYERRGQNKERCLKIGKDHKLEAYIRKRLLEDRYSPDVILGEIRMRGLEFERTICTKTLYDYIGRGIFAGIGNETLWEKRKRKKRKYKQIGRVSYTNRTGKSIEDRPKEIEAREEYGHWEGDSIKGKQGTTAGVLTLTERKSREEILIKMRRTRQEAVQEAMDRLEKHYGSLFRLKFKSITFDNGMEFTNWKSLEISALNPRKKRTKIYFAHAYSAWERGTNENHNRMIRRFIPKGTDIGSVPETEIERIQNWMNQYPRKVLGYKTPSQVAEENLRKTGKDFAFVAL